VFYLSLCWSLHAHACLRYHREIPDSADDLENLGSEHKNLIERVHTAHGSLLMLSGAVRRCQSGGRTSPVEDEDVHSD